MSYIPHNTVARIAREALNGDLTATVVPVRLNKAVQHLAAQREAIWAGEFIMQVAESGIRLALYARFRPRKRPDGTVKVETGGYLALAVWQRPDGGPGSVVRVVGKHKDPRPALIACHDQALWLSQRDQEESDVN